MNDERPPRGPSETAAPQRSESALILPGLPDCDCPQARAWRFLVESGHVLDLLGERDEWDRRRVASQTSRDLSAAGSWTRDSYAAIAKRRTEGSPLFPGHPTTKTGAQLRAEARDSWAKVEREIAARPSWL